VSRPVLRIVLATANPDKTREIHHVLATLPLAIELVPRPADVPDVEETGATLADNARLKARALCTAVGLPALADDTGLEVDALGGAPGVRAGRFAGDDATYADNVERLLRELEDVAPERRTARFATVAVVCFPDGHELLGRGEVEGVIASVPRGAGGFGYDPVFEPLEGGGRTFAEMTTAEKHTLSHRGRALRALAALLRDA